MTKAQRYLYRQKIRTPGYFPNPAHCKLRKQTTTNLVSGDWFLSTQTVIHLKGCVEYFTIPNHSEFWHIIYIYKELIMHD